MRKPMASSSRKTQMNQTSNRNLHPLWAASIYWREIHQQCDQMITEVAWMDAWELNL